MSEPRLRQAARALVFDAEDRIMLVRFDFDGVIVWATPGGGIKSGETHFEALRRELDEELGLRDLEIGPYVWCRTFLGQMTGSRWDGQTDHIYLVRTAAFDPEPSMSWEELNAEKLTELRWWTLQEIHAATAAGERFAPLAMGEYLVDLLRDGHADGDAPRELGW